MRKSKFISQAINAAIFIILEVAALNMLRNNGTLQRIWLARGAHAVMGTIWGGSQEIKHYFSLKQQNDSLAYENNELRISLAQLEAAVSDNMKQKAYSVPGMVGSYRYIPASIMKMGTKSQHNYLIIDKGYKDGVVEGAGIITPKGAIGIVDAVSQNYSYARSFKNHEMNISARLGKGGSIGPMSWDGFSSKGAILKEIPHHVEFSKGDTVYTSGHSSIFPPDIPLGTIGECKVVNGATYNIDISLFEDFGALRYVTVVQNIDKEEIAKLEQE
ncbi:MAG: rod shape-determining protein MreC [Bacteroidales bacterium]|nr:rod shape-determining protein MreC [Bacteroidales bacterium]